jgi:hypothetical protein
MSGGSEPGHSRSSISPTHHRTLSVAGIQNAATERRHHACRRRARTAWLWRALPWASRDGSLQYVHPCPRAPSARDGGGFARHGHRGAPLREPPRMGPHVKRGTGSCGRFCDRSPRRCRGASNLGGDHSDVVDLGSRMAGLVAAGVGRVDEPVRHGDGVGHTRRRSAVTEARPVVAPSGSRKTQVDRASAHDVVELADVRPRTRVCQSSCGVLTQGG